MTRRAASSYGDHDDRLRRPWPLALLDGLVEIPGVPTDEIHRIRPDVVTGPGLFMTEPLWAAVTERIAPAFGQPESQPLVVLDAYASFATAMILELHRWRFRTRRCRAALAGPKQAQLS